ncbi:MAG: hypothetical protein HN736_14010 [Anaerolineae bacterium]|jgi:hypothetical protein|nr:hypothetical protein [Anaerolineae bacterium]MBT3713145.1 hypothetical protein [Anaerolineae bacterium]MBT4309673.1 hypothetical protein [Anaerolineae bacterium]MBT4459433.1 hypothetical protein [Anaerolineae bacterium]MBT4842033.1 hypothetical protein [Anaerolineae bacterium]
MSNTVLITSEDPIIKTLNFQAYRSTVERQVERFLPAPDTPQDIEIATPWGEFLTANAGDYLVSELDTPPGDRWPVEAGIFEKTYMLTRPGFCVKQALTYLVPLVDAVNENADQEVVVETLEGMVSVRAGDFYLALGVEGEVWPYPKDKVGSVMALVDE